MKKKIFSVLLVCMLVFSAFAFVSCGTTEGSGSGSGNGSGSGDNPGVEKPSEDSVYYRQFGAKGDGKTDDFDAIVKAHEYANQNGKPVAADEGATYYIGAHAATVNIQTDVNWGTAKFIIDDSQVGQRDCGWNIFEVKSDEDSYNVSVPKGYSLKKGQGNLNIRFEKPVMLKIVNRNKKDYIRYGANQNGGSNRQEIILVDEDGDVDKDTPILWDYDTVTSMTAYSITDKEVTVQGGEFTTITNSMTVGTTYYARGIKVTRSNTTLLNIKHYIEGEPEPEENPPETPTPGNSSAPYNGFFNVSSANNVTIKNCIMTGHVAYTWKKPTGWVQQGTYDAKADNANNVAWVGCTQSNSISDTKFWGVMASNFCKNLKMDQCELSRFDAHQGVYNATITNTTLGRNFNILGAGTLWVENVTRTSGDNFIWLRSDYGSTWEGDAVFKNCTMETDENNFSIMSGSWTDWDFGYTCYLPENVTIDNFTIKGNATGYIYSSFTSSSANAVKNSAKNPYQITKTVTVKNQTSPLQLTSNQTGLFDDTQVIGLK